MQATLSSPRWQRRAFVIAGLALLALAALWFASRIPKTLAVFTIAAFIAFGAQPIVAWLERRMPRALAIAIVYVALVTIVVVLSLLVVPALFAQIQVLGQNAPAYISTMQGWLDSGQVWVRQHFIRNSILPPGTGDLRALAAAKLSLAVSAGLASISNIVIGAFTAAFVGLSAAILSAFFLFRGAHIAEPLYELFPAQRRPGVRALAGQMAHVFGAYVAGQIALCAITGSLIFAFSALAGFRFALLLGLLCGIAYAVPFVGQVFAQLLAVVLAAPQGGPMVLWVSAIVFGVGRFSDTLLVPKIMSESVGVSPIVVMFAVFAGGELFGVAGLLLGIPAAAVIKVAWQFFRAGGFKRVEEAAEDELSRPAPPVPLVPSAPAH